MSNKYSSSNKNRGWRMGS